MALESQTGAQDDVGTDLPQQMKEEADRIMTALAEATPRRWEASPTPQPRGDTARSLGEIPDPTADTALDTRRLALSAAITKGERSLALALGLLMEARRDLERALDRYDGTRRGER